MTGPTDTPDQAQPLAAPAPGPNGPPEREPVEAPAPEPLPPPAPLPVPTVAETVRTALNALLASSRDLRTLSIVAVLFGVALVAAPYAAAFGFFVIAPLISAFGPADDPLVVWLGLAAFVAMTCATIAYLVLAIQFPVMIIAVVGGTMSGRPLGLRQALRRARDVYWRALGASLAVGLVAGLPAGIIAVVAALTLGPTTQLALGVNILGGLIFTSPWVYVLPGIVLGGVGVRESLRRSWRLARFRWRLALTIALLGVVGGQIVTAAALAALGAVVTLATIAPGGAELATGVPPALAIGAVALIGAVVVSSLFFATQAVEVAPETSGFWSLTRYAAGLDSVRDAPREPLLRRPALVIYPLGLAATVVLAAGVAGSWPVSERGPWERVQIDRFSIELPVGWIRQADPRFGPAGSPFTAPFSNGADGHLALVVGATPLNDAAARFFETFTSVDDFEVGPPEEVAVGEATVQEATVLGRVFVVQRIELPALIDAGRLAGRDVTLVVSFPSADEPLSDFFLGEAKRFAHHIWLSALAGT